MEGSTGSRTSRRLTAAVAATIAALGIFAPSAGAGILDRYASPDGEATDACTQADPCDLRTAVEGAPDNGQIRLFGGLHDLGQTGLTIDGGKTVVSDSQNSFATVRTRGSSDPTLTVTEDASIRGFGVTSSELVEQVEQPPDPLPPLPPIVTPGGSALALEDSQVVADRIFVRAQSSDAACLMGGGLLRNSVCFNAIPAPEEMSDPAPGPAVSETAAGDETAVRELRGVTAFSRAGSGLELEVSEGANLDVGIRNSILSGGDTAPESRDIVTSGEGSVISDLDFSNYSSVEENAETSSIPAPGSLSNQTDVPIFSGAAQGNFRQDSDSPTIDAGDDTASDLGELDLAANERIQGDSIDIGAYEDTVVDPPPTAGAPTVILRDKPRKRTGKRSATFRFRAADTNEPATFRCKLDKRDFAACDSPKRYSGLGRGTHRFVVRARGANGKLGEPTRYRWTIKRKR